jgi:hypothetical protein
MRASGTTPMMLPEVVPSGRLVGLGEDDRFQREAMLVWPLAGVALEWVAVAGLGSAHVEPEAISESGRDRYRGGRERREAARGAGQVAAMPAAPERRLLAGGPGDQPPLQGNEERAGAGERERVPAAAMKASVRVVSFVVIAKPAVETIVAVSVAGCSRSARLIERAKSGWNSSALSVRQLGMRSQAKKLAPPANSQTAISIGIAHALIATAAVLRGAPRRCESAARVGRRGSRLSAAR